MYTQELLSFITKLLGRPHIHRNNEYAFNCPFCNHHKKKLQLNLETYNLQLIGIKLAIQKCQEIHLQVMDLLLRLI